jgi:hypothetical protein
MKANKILIIITAIALLTLTVTPVFANGDDHDYISGLVTGRKHIEIGLVYVDRVGDELVITYETDEGWYLVETHLIVAASLEEIPQTKKGNPKIGHFPYANEHNMATMFTYIIPVDGEAFFIAAHAVVYNECKDKYETAWGQGENQFEFPGNSWALGFTFPDPLS